MLAQHCPYVNILSLQTDRYLVGINTLAQRWANVHRWRVLTWLNCAGCITLGQHWTNVCLPLWFWITVCWKYYVDPTLGQCTPATCFNMTELRWVHYVYVGPTLDQSMHATLVLDNSLLRILRWSNYVVSNPLTVPSIVILSVFYSPSNIVFIVWTNILADWLY